MSVWDGYPANYRSREVQALVSAAQAGECAALIGLSGSGKSNLMCFIAHRLGRDGSLPGVPRQHPAFVLVDCNRLPQPAPEALFRLVLEALGSPAAAEANAYAALDQAVACLLQEVTGLCLLLDRFDALARSGESLPQAVASNLRALRDAHKYELTYIIASRRPLDPHSELAELFFAHTLWLGALNESDARWNVARFTQRNNLDWNELTVQRILQLSGGYPALLRAVCEAHAAGCPLVLEEIVQHTALQKRVAEFWADQPGPAELDHSGLTGHPLLNAAQPPQDMDTSQLTAKENLLWEFFKRHPNQVCEKDDLIRAVWPEDRIFERGIRDDSLAQLVRRLREKIELQPSAPRIIHTVPGRGYRYTPQ